MGLSSLALLFVFFKFVEMNSNDCTAVTAVNDCALCRTITRCNVQFALSRYITHDCRTTLCDHICISEVTIILITIFFVLYIFQNLQSESKGV